jgi:hypothetical protein
MFPFVSIRIRFTQQVSYHTNPKMKHKKGSKPRKPRKKPAKRKQSKPRATKSRGSASGGRKLPKTRKRPVAKKTAKKKKTIKKKKSSRSQVKRRGLGRSAGLVDSLRGHYTDARDRLGRFYDENQEAIHRAGKVALALNTVAGLGYGAYQYAPEISNAVTGWLQGDPNSDYERGRRALEDEEFERRIRAGRRH